MSRRCETRESGECGSNFHALNVKTTRSTKVRYSTLAVNTFRCRYTGTQNPISFQSPSIAAAEAGNQKKLARFMIDLPTWNADCPVANE